MRGLMRTVMWTEIKTALEKDFPDLKLNRKAPPHLSDVIKANADYLFELTQVATTPPDAD